MRRGFAFLRRHLLPVFGTLALLAVIVVLWIFSAPIALWLRSAQPIDPVTFLQQHLLAVGIVGGCLAVVALIWLPKRQAARLELTPKERFEVENEARKTLLQMVGGIGVAAVIAGLYFTWSSVQISREGQVTERFTKAIDQLGNAKLEIRLGGIYALERIARNSARDHWPVMEVLTAYVRDNAPWPPKNLPRPPKKVPPPKANQFGLFPQEHLRAIFGESPPKLPIDIQAIITVLGRRTRAYETVRERWLQELDLSRTDLQGAIFWGSHLGRATLQGAHLEGADFRESSFTGANFREAHLDGAIVQGARLQEVNFRNANLNWAILEMTQMEGADLTEAQLNGADLDWANLQRAFLGGASLEGASLGLTNLTQALLSEAYLGSANLTKAYLKGAILGRADLEGANLSEAYLEGADLFQAQLTGANFRSAHLKGAKNLTVEQLSTVSTLYQALLDRPLREQIEQRHRHLLEKPRE
jgi:uncharacterized protein YjbI with pentapeptide repeats